MSRRISVLFALMAAVLVAAVVPAKAEDYSNIRIVRLSFVEGDVQYRHAGEEWQMAGMNLPIQKGFAVQTGNGYAEVEFENGLAVRLATHSSVEFTELALVDGHRVTRLMLGSGTAIITANLARMDELSVATSLFDLKVPRSGRFRVDVSATESWVTLFHGKVDFVSGAGNISLSGHQTVHEGGADLSAPQIVRSPAQDAFDKWVSQREQALEIAQIGTADYLQNKYYSTGFADLYNYGSWMNVPGYGMGWQPWGMGGGWMPYVDGLWSFMPVTGWNWMSNEPWGWVPYHFGGWVNVQGMGWVWVPGGGNLTWQPANANWVQVNNQTGWIPAAPPIFSTKSLKGAPRTAPPVVIVAGQGGGGVIRAGGRITVVPGGGIQRGIVPQQTFTVIGTLPLPGVNRGNGPTRGVVPTQGTTGLQGRTVNGNGPAGVRAPVTPNAGLRQGAPTFTPPTMQAPKSMPAPPVARGAGPTGFPGGGNGGIDASRGISGAGGTSNGPGPMGMPSTTHGTTPPASGTTGGTTGTGTGTPTGKSGGTVPH